MEQCLQGHKTDPYIEVRRRAEWVEHPKGLLPEKASEKLSSVLQLIRIKGIIDSVSGLDIQPKWSG